MIEASKIAKVPTPIDWRKTFHTGSELPDGDTVWIVENILPEGIGFFGALSGAGKTWVALSLARAISTGTPFLGAFDVPVGVPVLYLCPEMSAKGFKRRLKLFKIPMTGDSFRCITISDGLLELGDKSLIAAITELKPVIFLDTMRRFSHSDDENDAAKNQAMTKAIFRLMNLGARAVIFLHHSPKSSREQKEMTLENCLSGTGDIGAICDVVFGIRPDRGPSEYTRESKRLVRLEFACVKMRDGAEPEPIRIQLFPNLEKNGDFELLTKTVEAIGKDDRKTEIEALREAITKNLSATYRELQEETGIGLKRIKAMAKSAGFEQNPESGLWNKIEENMFNGIDEGFIQ